MMQTVNLGCALLALVLLGGTRFPATVPQDQDKPAANRLVLDAGEHDLKELIDRAAAFLKRNYVFAKADFDNAPDRQIVLQNRLELDPAGCEEVLSQLAYTKGFMMLPVNPRRGIYEWVYMQGPKRGEIGARPIGMTAEEVLQHAGAKTCVITSYELQGINANAAQNTLRQFFTNRGSPAHQLSIGTVGNANALLLSGFSDEVATALKLLQRLDRAEATAPDFSQWRASVERRLEALEQGARREAAKVLDKAIK